MKYSIHTKNCANHTYKSQLIFIKWTTYVTTSKNKQTKIDQRIEHSQNPRSFWSLYFTKKTTSLTLVITITYTCLRACCKWCHETWTLLCLSSFAQHLWNVIMFLLIKVIYSFRLLYSIFLWLYYYTFVHFLLMGTWIVMSNATLHILISVFWKAYIKHFYKGWA